MRFRWLIVMAVLVASCRPAAPEEPVLARVDDAVITAEEFQLNYEFGFGHLRRSENPRRAYLEFMLLEKALSNKARDLQLDTLAAVRHAMRTLREEVLIEQVFQTYVLDRIEVTQEEIEAEINKGAVRFQFRFLPATSLADASQLHEAVLQRGYDAVLAERQAEMPEIAAYGDRLTSPLLAADEVDPELLAIVQNLAINTPSEPVQYQGNWYIMEVTDIRRERLADVDYEQQAESARKVIYNRKAMEQGAAFVASTMEPLGVATKRTGFEILNDALWEWYSDETPERNLLFYIEEAGRATAYVQRLVDAYETPLVSFGDQTWSVRDFLQAFTPGRYIIRPDDPRAFKARLADIVALVVRDAVFLDLADRDGLEETPAFRRAARQWEDKWLFQEYAALIDAERSPSDQALRAYYAAGTRNLDAPALPFDSLDAGQRERLIARWGRAERRRVADSLLATGRVWIDEAMLDTIPLNVSTVNPYLTVHLLKNNSNKMAFPIVDPNWRPVSPN